MVAGCETPRVMEDGPDELLVFETLGMGQQGAVRDTIEVITRDEVSYQEAMAKVTPLAPIPSVDFSQMMVSLIAIPTESGGYIVEVRSVEKTGDLITVSYDVAVPGQDCITLQALSLPFQVVAIQQSAGQVEFVRTNKTYSCGL